MDLIKYFFVSLSFFTFISFPALGQSVKITPKKVIYTRANPFSSLKKTFTVTYPIIKGVSPRLAKKIENSISYQKVTYFEVSDETGESQWLEEAEYSVCYNKNGVLCIYLSFLGVGAFESYWGKYVVVDLATGNRVKAKDVFINSYGLVQIVKKVQKAEIDDSKKEIQERTDIGDFNTDELFEFVDFKRINLEDFSVDDKGVTFYYSYSFPRIIYFLEPSGSYFLSWKEIKPFIKRGGLLGKFIH